MAKIIISICFFVFSINSSYATESKHVKIASGSLLEGYYAIGLKLCRYISHANKGAKCEVIPSSGTIENLMMLHRGEVDFAFAQSNFALDSYEGKGYFATHEPFSDMYQLLRLHDEVFTVIVKDEDKIMKFSDLDGRKISNGPPRSDSTATYIALSSYYDFVEEPKDIEMSHEDYAKEFCKSKVDAILMMTGHPNALVNFITHECETDFLDIEEDKIAELISHNRGFKKFILEAGSYPGITESKNTIAVPAIFVTHKGVDKKLVQNFIEYLGNSLSSFKISHPVLYDLEDGHFTSGFILPGFSD